ncbi:MAG: biotin--[acetyl-CoA-carboxylase] ligase [Parachlamydiales bacterium]|jgi:BirA family biotin operon repressor/biotin-[acetyl-CoA-carboxylase] ligase
MKYVDIFLPKTDSTQEYAKKNASSFDKTKITAIYADEQTHGKGRFNRKWISCNKDNLNITFYFQLKPNTLHLISIGHILALSLIEVLRDNNLDPKIKWPNDIMLSNKKLAGVLCEIQTKIDQADVFLGIGINVNPDQNFLNQIDQPATSLKVETDKIWDKKKLFEDLKQKFLKNLEIFRTSGFTPLHESYENLLLYKGNKITFFDGKNEYKGVLHSITCEGKLNLYLNNKEIITFAAGDIINK